MGTVIQSVILKLIRFLTWAYKWVGFCMKMVYCQLWWNDSMYFTLVIYRERTANSLDFISLLLQTWISTKEGRKMAAPAETAAPKTELQELQMKANQVTDEVSRPSVCSSRENPELRIFQSAQKWLSGIPTSILQLSTRVSELTVQLFIMSQSSKRPETKQRTRRIRTGRRKERSLKKCWAMILENL